MVVIMVHQSLSNSALYEHRCLENINKLCRTTCECEYQQQYKSMIEKAMVSTSEVCTNNIPMTPNPFVSTRNPSAQKQLCQFTETLNSKHKTSICTVCTFKAKGKAIKKINILWSNTAMRRDHTIINKNIREDLYH